MIYLHKWKVRVVIAVKFNQIMREIPESIKIKLRKRKLSTILFLK